MLEFARNASVLVTSHSIHNKAIFYILRMHIVHQTTPCMPSSNMCTLSCILLQNAFSQAHPGIKLACSAACIKLALALLFVSGWLNAVHQASIWLNVVH